jgi:competence protein ComEC
VTLYETREGDTIDFGAVDVDVLGPPEPYLESEARNENSIVLKLTHGETSFLLSGNAEDN